MKFFWDYYEMLIFLKTFTDNYTHGKQKISQEKISISIKSYIW